MRMPRLGLLAPGDDASVVVGEHDNWLAHEGRVKDPLAGAEEVVAVDECETVHGNQTFINRSNSEAGIKMCLVTREAFKDPRLINRRIVCILTLIISAASEEVTRRLLVETTAGFGGGDSLRGASWQNSGSRRTSRTDSLISLFRVSSKESMATSPDE